MEMLKEKGFKNPIICPVLLKAGYLAKQFQIGKFTRYEERELYNYVDKFEQMKLIVLRHLRILSLKIQILRNFSCLRRVV